MAYPTVFANLPGSPATNPASLFDTMFGICGNQGNIPCSVSGTNALTLTPLTNFFLPAAYQNYQMVSFVANSNSTGTVTAQIGALAFVNVYTGRLSQAGAGDIVANATYLMVFNSALNSGSGGFQIVNAASPALTGRLTLVSATPVMNPSTAGTSGATTVYYTPYTGNFVELSQAISDTSKSPAAVVANGVYDIFLWNDAGTPRATRGPIWTNNNTRSAGTALVRGAGGLLVNNVGITNGPGANAGLYLGTIASNSLGTIDFVYGTSANGGGLGTFFVWNYYNRVRVSSTVTDNTNYTYSSTARQAHSNVATTGIGNAVQFVIGVQEDSVGATVHSVMQQVVNGSSQLYGLQMDAVNSFATYFRFDGGTSGASMVATSVASHNFFPGIGIHVVSAIEASDGVNANTFNRQNDANLTVSFKG
jgi:hypothetical protein